MTCAELKTQLQAAQAQLLQFQISLSNAQGTMYLHELQARQQDTGAPATFTAQTVQTRLSQLQAQQPPNMALVTLYQTIAADIQTVAILQSEVLGAQGQVYQIQTQMQQQGCQ
jgi:hypothetical protein